MKLHTLALLTSLFALSAKAQPAPESAYLCQSPDKSIRLELKMARDTFAPAMMGRLVYSGTPPAGYDVTCGLPTPEMKKNSPILAWACGATHRMGENVYTRLQVQVYDNPYAWQAGARIFTPQGKQVGGDLLCPRLPKVSSNTSCKRFAAQMAIAQFQSDFPNRRHGAVGAYEADPGQIMVTIKQDSDEGDETYAVDTRMNERHECSLMGKPVRTSH